MNIYSVNIKYTILLTLDTMLYILSTEFTHLITSSLCLWPTPPPFPPTLILISSFSSPDLPYTTPALILGDSSKYVDWYLQYAGHLVP